MEQTLPWMGAGLPGSVEVDPRLEILNRVKGLILDIDGVFFEGERILPGSVELITHLNQEGTPHVFLSNNTTFPFQHHVDKLGRLGTKGDPKKIITAARITALTLAAEANRGACCLVIGEQGLIEALAAQGFEITHTDWRRAEYVVVGMDRQLTYDRLKCAALAIRNGAQFISSNPDPCYPDGELVVPASGAIQAALEVSTSVRARVTGKPALPGFRIALELLGTRADEAGILGDQMEVDIAGGKNAGIRTFLVLSSLTPGYTSATASDSPDAVFTGVLEFYRLWLKRNNL